MSKEIMKLALEALEGADWYINQLEMIVYSADDAGTQEDRLRVQQAITAMRKAIANEALDKKAENARELGLDYEPAQQEPVAFFNPQSKGFYWAKPTKVIPPVTVDVEPLPLYTSPPAQRT